MANKIRTEGLLQSQVYENGNLYSISIADLKGNEIAITQLVNDYNTKVQTIEKLQQSEKRLSSELQYQNASPFFSIIAALISTANVNFVALSIFCLVSERFWHCLINSAQFVYELYIYSIKRASFWLKIFQFCHKYS